MDKSASWTSVTWRSLPHQYNNNSMTYAVTLDYCALIVFHVDVGRWVDSILEALRARKQSAS
jgi:hypothetical protein